MDARLGNFITKIIHNQCQCEVEERGYQKILSNSDSVITMQSSYYKYEKQNANKTDPKTLRFPGS